MTLPQKKRTQIDPKMNPRNDPWIWDPDPWIWNPYPWDLESVPLGLVREISYFIIENHP